MLENIVIKGANQNNLKNINLTIPKNKLVVFSGVSGCGKSTLAFDTIFAEGQRRYIETFSAYARNMLGNLERPDVDNISGLSPVIAIEQKTINKNPRSTIGTTTEIYDFLRLLYARVGMAYSYISGEQMVKYSDDKIVQLILNKYDVTVDIVEGGKVIYNALVQCLVVKTGRGEIAGSLVEGILGMHSNNGYIVLVIGGNTVKVWQFNLAACAPLAPEVDYGNLTGVLCGIEAFARKAVFVEHG